MTTPCRDEPGPSRQRQLGGHDWAAAGGWRARSGAPKRLQPAAPPHAPAASGPPLQPALANYQPNSNQLHPPTHTHRWRPRWRTRPPSTASTWRPSPPPRAPTAPRSSAPSTRCSPRPAPPPTPRSPPTPGAARSTRSRRMLTPTRPSPRRLPCMTTSRRARPVRCTPPRLLALPAFVLRSQLFAFSSRS